MSVGTLLDLVDMYQTLTTLKKFSRKIKFVILFRDVSAFK